MRILLLILASLPAWAVAPILFYSDITSGPATGGESNHGVYVSLYGAGLGTSQGGSTVTLNGTTMTNCPVWQAHLNEPINNNSWQQKITCQINGGSTGNFVVTVGGVASNGLSFTVRSGNIYFVATSGNDSNNGAFATPWLTVTHAIHSGGMAAGDTLYLRNGVSQNTNDNYSACLAMDGALNGSSGNEIAIINYPGESAQIGAIVPNSSGGCDNGIRTNGAPGSWPLYFVFAGLNIRSGGGSAIGAQMPHWRVIGNDIQCPISNSQDGCAGTGDTDTLYFYGNHVHNAGLPPIRVTSAPPANPMVLTTASPIGSPSGNLITIYGATGTGCSGMNSQWNATSISGTTITLPFNGTGCTYTASSAFIPVATGLFHGLYWGDHSSHIYTGWSIIQDVFGGRGIQIYSSDQTVDLFDIQVHDSFIFNTSMDGIVITNVDTSQTGGANFYNLVVFNVGQYNPPEGGSGAFNCMLFDDYGVQSGGQFEAYNNTCYAYGLNQTPWFSGNAGYVMQGGTGNPTKKLRIRNDIIQATYSGSSLAYYGEDNGSGGFCVPPNCGRVIGSNNLMFGLGTPPSDPTHVTSTVNSDALFTNTSIFDLSLQSGSPAIAAGTTITGLNYDILGNPRTGTFSIGAFAAPAEPPPGGSAIKGKVTLSGKQVIQ